MMSPLNVKVIWTKRYIILFVAVWSIGVAASALLNLHGVYKDTLSKAYLEAKTISQNNLAFRRWNTLHEGIYAKISDSNPPNPYLKTKNKTINTVDGSNLTTITHYQMTKQAYDLVREQNSALPTINRTVSLNPLNPENTPDGWEEKALHLIEKQKKVYSEITNISGFSYMRLLTPYIVEKKCIRCHRHQRYEVGDIRGALSVSVPMAPYIKNAAATRSYIIYTHVILWIVGLITIAIFFIGLKKYREDITDSSKKFQIVSEFAHNIEYWLQENNTILFISPSCKRITGYSRTEFQLNPSLLIDIVHPDDVDAFKEHLLDFKSAIHEDYQYRIYDKNGNLKWVSHTCSPIEVEGKFLGRRGSIKDITNQKALEEQLFQSHKVEAIGHFAGGIAHDFNNVLSSITTFAHLLEGELKENEPDLINYVNYINIASKLGKHLTSNLLAFGRPQVMNLKVVNLNEILNNIADIIKSLLTEEIEFVISYDDNEIPIFADQHQIEQVIINLCTNARDAMAEGGRLEVKSNLTNLEEISETGSSKIPPGEYMVLTVSDTGHGIESEKIPNIFEPFYSTKEKNKGTGLGLAIINSIVKQHKAFINVESKIGKGTTFHVFFPISKKAAAPEEKNIKMEKPSFRADKKKPETIFEAEKKAILLVEDEELVRESLKAILDFKGYSVMTAVNGEEAIGAYRTHKDVIDLLILDVMLPKKNGLEVYRHISKISTDVKVIFISGYTDDVNITKEIKNNGLSFIQKPLDIDKFINELEKTLGQ